MKTFHKVVLFSAVFFVTGGCIGYMVGAREPHSLSTDKLRELHPIRLNDPTYKFINPLLAYVIPPADEDPRFSLLREKISNLIDDEKQNGLLRASVFLSDLNGGKWIGINEDYAYHPASMFKVVIMTAYLKGEEQMPGLLDKEFVYTKDADDKTKKSAVNSTTDLQIGKSYKISGLIDDMIINSDNGAAILLAEHMDAEFLRLLFELLDIESFNEFDMGEGFTISPRQYSLFFRIIYSATFLNPELSEKALDTLSQTTFNTGLVAGVQEDYKVAHKYGMYVPPPTEDADFKFGLSDCGIIYYEDTPYFLCVMTEGDDVDELKSVIKGVSALVFEDYRAN